MDIEFDFKNIFKELTNSSEYVGKMLPVTPSTFIGKK
jgi:hypothetical protein